MKEEEAAREGRKGKISPGKADVNLFHLPSQKKGGLGGKGAWSGLFQETENILHSRNVSERQCPVVKSTRMRIQRPCGQTQDLAR